MATRHIQSDVPGGVVNDLSGYTYAEVNPIRFSTKYWDAETGLGYWGYRYYSARLGRWLSPDPLEEDGGLNLYAYVNDPLSGFDPLGLQATTQPAGEDDKTVCCKLRRTHRLSGDGLGPSVMSASTEWVTTSCECVSAANPLACCRCEHETSRSGFGWSAAVYTKDARKGPCCYCTVAVERQPLYRGWKMHHWLSVRCPNGGVSHDLNPPEGPKSERLKPKWNATWQGASLIDRSDAPGTVSMFRTSCEKGQKAIDNIKSQAKLRAGQGCLYHYPWHQCRTSAVNLYEAFKYLYSDPFYSTP